MAEPVETSGGQILKFMGDGMLGTFELPAEGGAAARGATTVGALEAALDALARVSELNETRRAAGQPTMAPMSRFISAKSLMAMSARLCASILPSSARP